VHHGIDLRRKASTSGRRCNAPVLASHCGQEEQRFVSNIYEAKRSDFIPAVERVYHTPLRPSGLEVKVLTASHS
jgi:hypothetical protein